jgi:predicted amidophosphoribosyltransferase
MCGCMLMHAMMNHEEHQHTSPSAPAPAGNVVSDTSGRQCAHCGFPLGQGFAFCPNCGMSLKTTECSACGQKVDPNWSACAYCGSPLGEVEKQPAHHKVLRMNQIRSNQ